MIVVYFGLMVGHSGMQCFERNPCVNVEFLYVFTLKKLRR